MNARNYSWEIVADVIGLQIRIVTDTHEDDEEKSKKKKKPHRGYAFIVYEREKDMKGTASSTFLLTSDHSIAVLIRSYPASKVYPQLLD